MTTAKFEIGRGTINILPDDVLLEVFDHYTSQGRKIDQEKSWQTLVHVCQKWRCVVFGLPRRLNLQLVCRPTKSVREMLDIWPPLPIVIRECDGEPSWQPIGDMDNIVAALEHNDRIRDIFLRGLLSWQLEKVLTAMRRPFPALIELWLGRERNEDETVPTTDPDLLSGVSAPSMLSLQLQCIPIQGLPNLLLSATHLTNLRLYNIPLSGYISPEAMMTGISALTRLETLFLQFDPRFEDQFSPDQTTQRPPLPTRTHLPALISFTFQGECEYLEHIVAGIDTPLLDHLNITLSPQLSFDTPQFFEFISRTPSLILHDEAHISFYGSGIHVALPPPFYYKGLKLQFLFGDPDWQLSSMIQICASSISPAISPVIKRLRIYVHQECWDDNIENNQWLDFLRPYNSVKDLYLSRYIAPALQELVGERVTEVLPDLQSLYLELHRSQLVQDVVEQFIASRQLSGHHITLSPIRWVQE